jgi:hypothetical protein
MRTLVLACTLALICSSVSSGQTHSSANLSKAAASPLARLRSKIPVDELPILTVDALAGHFTSSPDELRRRVGPILSGDDLYLFPDGSYLYSTWSDIPPTAIQDKGSWVVSGDELTLKSDSDITWNPGAERRYLLVRRASHPDEILAVGRDRELAYFEKHADRDPEFMLLLVSKVRIAGISRKTSVELKKELMQKAWRPEFFKPK